MRYILFAALLVLTGCATNKEPKVVYKWLPSPPTSRHMANKDGLLYSYQIGINHYGNYDKVFADATNWCAKYKKVAVERNPPACSYNDYGDIPPETICVVDFACK